MKKLFLLFLIPLLWVSCPAGDSSSSGVKISLDKNTLEIRAGKTKTLTATVTDAANKAVTWTTSDANIATVSGGTVTAVAAGTATITVASREDTSKTAACSVTVNPPFAKGDIGAKDGLSGSTAAEYLDEHNIYLGWNLGNGFDAGSGYGTWTRKIDEDFLPKVAAAGFTMVRIPVTWNSYIGAAPDYTINTAMINELAQVVDWAYDSGLVTIINLHHESSWLSLRANSDLMNDSRRDAVYAKFEKVWEQIAARFKDYGDWLIFEPFNELHNGDWGNSIIPNEQAIVNTLNQKFTDKVRASGGKNAERFLVVQPVCAKPNQAMDDDFKLPTDTAKNKQIVSMHYYLPEGFALATDNVMNTWGSDNNKSSMSGNFERYADKFTKKGIPLILGESGASYQNRTDPEANAVAADARLVYMDYLCREAKRNGIIPIYWDNGTIYAGNDAKPGENFGLWDRTSSGNLELFEGMQAVIDAMVNAIQ